MNFRRSVDAFFWREGPGRTVLLGQVLRADNPKRGSGEGHSSGRVRRGEIAPLAVLRQSLSGVQRGHSGTHKGWDNP